MSEAAGSSTAHPEAGATTSPGVAAPSQQEEKENEVLDVSTEGGASTTQAVRTKQPAPIYDKNGAEYNVPQVTIDAIESFTVPVGFQQVGAREDSFLYSLGNYYATANVAKSSEDFSAHYKCQVGACRTGPQGDSLLEGESQQREQAPS